MRSGAPALAYGYGMAGAAAAAAALAPLPRVAAVALATACLAGLAWDLADRRRIPGWALTATAVAAFLASILPLTRERLAEQSVTALCLLLAAKLLGTKRRRDHLQILAVSLMVVAGAASLGPELAFAGLFAAALVLGVCQLVWLPFSELSTSARPALVRRLAAAAALMTALSLPVAAALFLLLPRSVNPFWSGLGSGRGRGSGVSGVSDSLRLGEVARIALSGEVAFRAELDDSSGPLPATPYWRGGVLEVTDGRRWLAAERSRPSSRAPDGAARRITYYVEPHGGRQLFLLESPAAASIGARVQALGARRLLRLPSALDRRLRYEGVSVQADRFAERLTDEERALNLHVPPGLSPRIGELARSLAAGEPDASAAARRILAHFGQGFTYSLEVPAAEGDPLEAFLFRHRSGYCEYFAASLAVMLRAAGIPARVVGGYLGGEYVPGGNYYRVTQAAAHAWVEAYFEDGWVRLDPTPAAGELGSTFAARRGQRTRLWLDRLRMRWNSWVVQYDAESQLSLARAGARRLRDVRPGRVLSAATAAAALVLAALTAPLLLRRRRLPVERRIARFEALAARDGAARDPSEGPITHAARFARARPARSEDILRFAELAAACRYGGRAVDAPALEELDRRLGRLARRR